MPDALSVLLGSMEEGEDLSSLDCEWLEDDDSLRIS